MHDIRPEKAGKVAELKDLLSKFQKVLFWLTTAVSPWLKIPN